MTTEEYQDAAERERRGEPETPGRRAAFRVSVAALVVVAALLLWAAR